MKASGRQSINPRASNAFGARHVQESRPIGDKVFQQSCQKRILEYLQSKKTDFVITPRHLQNPSAKDFSSILTALMKQIDETFEITAKIDEEVPALFKNLGYPFNISKNSLLAVGAPNTWPSLLAALSWLLDLVLMKECALDAEEDDFYNREQTEDELFAEHLLRCYELFLSGQEYCEEIQDLKFQIEKRAKEVTMQTNKMKELLIALRNEKEGLKLSDQNPKTMDEQIKLLETEVESLSNIENFLKNREYLESQLTFLKDENELCRQAISAKYNELEDLKAKINAQELSLDDKNRIEHEKSIIEQAIRDIKTQREIEQVKKWELDGTLQTLINGCWELQTQYRKAASDLGIIPHTAKYASEKDLNIKFNPEALMEGKGKLIEPSNPMQVVKDHVTELQAKIDADIAILTNETYQIGHENDEKASLIPEYDAKITQLSTNLKKAQAVFQNQSDPNNQKILEQKTRELDELNNIIEEIKEECAEWGKENSRVFETTEQEKREFARFQIDSIKEKKECIQIIRNDCQHLMTHKINVLDIIVDVENFMKVQLTQ